MAESSFGIVRRGGPPSYNDGATSQIGITTRGELLTCQALPPRAEVTRQGKSWSVMTATGSAFTNVATMPTTLAVLALYNGDPSRCYVIDSISFLCLTSVTAASNIALIYQVGAPAVLTDDTAQLINSPLGKVYDGRAKRAINVTTMVANKWTICGVSGSNSVVSIGSAAIADIEGRIVLPPTSTLGVNAVLGTATGTSLMGIAWHEVEMATL